MTLHQENPRFHCAEILCIRHFHFSRHFLQVCYDNPTQRSRFIRCVYNMLNSTSSAVRYDAAGVLVTLSSAPTAVKVGVAVGVAVCPCYRVCMTYLTSTCTYIYVRTYIRMYVHVVVCCCCCVFVSHACCNPYYVCAHPRKYMYPIISYTCTYIHASVYTVLWEVLVKIVFGSFLEKKIKFGSFFGEWLLT